MVTEPLDVKRALRLVRRHKIIVAVAVVLGFCGGATFSVLRPALVTSEAWVVLSPSASASAASQPAGSQPLDTQVVIARSDPVLKGALDDIRPVHSGLSLPALRDEVSVKARTDAILGISAEDKTASQAERIANAVAQSYVVYVGRPGNLPGGPVQARILQSAADATATKPSSRLLGMGLLGGLVGAVLAAFGILAVTRGDRRLKERDEIADSIGLPVLASIAVDRPSDAAGWRKLLENYKPGAVDAWRLRTALRYVGLAEQAQRIQRGAGFTLAIVSSSFDRKALALGPQLAVFAASRGIPTALVVAPEENVAAMATLRAACVAGPSEPLSLLRVIVGDRLDGRRQPDVGLTVLVQVLDDQVREATDQIRATAALLGVSAGVATAEQLARLAANAAVTGHDILGILVADPDPRDTTTGRLPQLQRPAQRRRPTRITGDTMEIR